MAASSSPSDVEIKGLDTTQLLEHGWCIAGDLRQRYRGAPKDGADAPMRLKRTSPSFAVRHLSMVAAAAATTLTAVSDDDDVDGDGDSATVVDGRLRTLVQIAAPEGSLTTAAMSRLCTIQHVSQLHPSMLPLRGHWLDALHAKYNLVYDTTRALTLAEVMRERSILANNETPAAVATMAYHHQWVLRCVWQLCHVVHTIYQSEADHTSAAEHNDDADDEKSTAACLTSTRCHGYISSAHIYMCDSNGCTTPWSVTGICCSNIRVSYPWLPPPLSTDAESAALIAALAATETVTATATTTTTPPLAAQVINELRQISPLFSEVAPERLWHLSTTTATDTAPSSSSVSAAMLRNNSRDNIVSPRTAATVASDIWSIGCILLDGIRGSDPLKHSDNHFCYAACTPSQLDALILECGYKHKATTRIMELLRGLLAVRPLQRWTPARAMHYLAHLLPELLTPATAVTMPLACRATLCQRRYDDNRATFDLIATLTQQPAACDLLISLTVAATRLNRLFFVNPLHVTVTANSSKRLDFLVPPHGKIPLRYNAGADGRGMDEIEDGETGPWLDYDRIRACLAHLPSYRNMLQMASSSSSSLVDDLFDCDPLLPSLLQWIVTATSHQLRPLTVDEQFHEMGTSFQFAVTPHDSQREAGFQALKRQAGIDRAALDAAIAAAAAASTPAINGTSAPPTSATASPPVASSSPSVWGFHGSDTSNWHSILRTGLKMMSHTAWANSAPVYGPGIYLSTSSRTAMNYAKFSGGWPRSSMGGTIRLCALCEVVNHPQLREPAPFYVIPHPEWVMIRYLFVYQNAGPADAPTSAPAPVSSPPTVPPSPLASAVVAAATSTTTTTSPPAPAVHVDHHRVPEVHVDDRVRERAVRLCASPSVSPSSHTPPTTTA